MLSVQPIIATESKVHPGVTFKVRSLSRRDRAVREFDLIEARAALQDIQSEWLPIAPPEEGVEDKRTPEQVKHASVLWMKHAAIFERDIKPAVIKSALVSIEGVEIAGVVVTPETLFSGGSQLDALIDEIYQACEHASGLTEEQAKNSQSPTTSNGPVAGEEKSSSDAAQPVAA